MDRAASQLSSLNNQMTVFQKMQEQISCPKQSLEEYRKKSKIDQQFFKEHFFGRNWTYRERCFELVKNHKDIFKHQHLEEFNRVQQRYYSFKALKGFFEKLNITFEEFQKDPNIVTMTSAGMYSYDPSVCVKFGVHFHLYTKTIMNLGTEKHSQYLERAKTLQDIGAFALTEMGHGSNVRNVLTTAIFDQQKQCFIINTPHDLAMKFWIGATANLANMATVFAQLFIGDKEYGVHAFLVEIRDKSNHMLKNGVIIGDCGPKNGNNGIDNGFLIFKNVEIPLDNLLDKFSSVTTDGKFIAQIEDPDKRFAVQLGSLSGGRIMLCMYGAINSLNALTIGIRYSAIRKQFGIPGEKEISILEYPLTQIRLIPTFATALIHLIGSVQLTLLWDRSQAIMFDPKSPQLAEVHAISSCLKGLTNDFANQTTLECRQILGGHGYHQFNRLGTILMDGDVNTTWEGDTNVLMQQTSKFLLDGINKKFKGKEVLHETLQFLSIQPSNQVESPLLPNETDNKLLKEALLNNQNLSRAIEHRCNTLVQVSALRFTKNLKTQSDMFAAWNATQPFFLQNASRAYADVYCMQKWIEVNSNVTGHNKVVLDKIFQLWALTIINNDYALYRDTNYISQKHSIIIKDLILQLSSELKDEVIGILDALAPPDEVLGSPFAQQDGDIYNSYLKHIYQSKDCFARVPWWQEIHSKVEAAQK